MRRYVVRERVARCTDASRLRSRSSPATLTSSAVWSPSTSRRTFVSTPSELLLCATYVLHFMLLPVDVSTDPGSPLQENTIGVFVILGSTYTGHYEDVQGMSDELDKLEARTGISVPIHVDAASGGFFAPFASPKLVWDFRIPRVHSINTSAHKWGKCYVGCGYVIWKDSKHLPKEMIFELASPPLLLLRLTWLQHYLGSIEYSFSLNFSRPAAPILGLYFNLIHFGFEGYRSISLHDAKLARLLSRALEASKYYDVISTVHRTIEGASASKDDDDIASYVPALPVVAFKFSESFKKANPNVEQRWIQTLLR